MTVGSTSCRRCNRGLKNPKAVAAGIGPICAAKAAAEHEGEPERQAPGHHDEMHSESFVQEKIDSFEKMATGVSAINFYLARRADGKASITYCQNTSQQAIPHIMYHSPTGLEFGYGGSGPADCARSILTHAAGRIIADSLYQEFKRDFIAGLGDGDTIRLCDIAIWVTTKLKDWKARLHKKAPVLTATEALPRP